MKNLTIISAVQMSINLRGYESTIGMTASGTNRIRKNSGYTRAAYKMIFHKCCIWAASRPEYTRIFDR